MKENEFSSLAEMVRVKRDELGLSTQELSERSGVSATRINQIENLSLSESTGKVRRPKPETVERLARALGLSAAKLLLAAGYAPRQKQSDELKAVIEEDEQMAVLFSGYSTMTKKQKAEMKPILEMVAREMDRLIAEEEAEAKKKPKDKGK